MKLLWNTVNIFLKLPWITLETLLIQPWNFSEIPLRTSLQQLVTSMKQTVKNKHDLTLSLLKDLLIISTISGPRSLTILTVSGFRNVWDQYYDFRIQKLWVFWGFWIQKSHHFLIFWIKKFVGPFSWFLDPETAVFLQYLDPEKSPFLQLLVCQYNFFHSPVSWMSFISKKTKQ